MFTIIVKSAKKITTSSLHRQTSEPQHSQLAFRRLKSMSMLPHTLQKPLPPQRSQTALMQMITLHPEQHIRHRKQRQCRPTTSKILVNENVRQSLRNNYTWFTGCLSPKNTDPSFLKIIKKLRYQETVSTSRKYIRLQTAN